MRARMVTINGKLLNDAEAATLRMILDMAIMDLQSLDPQRMLEEQEVSAHLYHVAQLMKLVSAE